MYDAPEEYLDEEEEKERKRRRWCIDKALSLAEKRSTSDERTDMDESDIVESASRFHEFITQEPGS
jgi:hypothetical protein